MKKTFGNFRQPIVDNLETKLSTQKFANYYEQIAKKIEKPLFLGILGRKANF